jgi:hypothetical protein
MPSVINGMGLKLLESLKEIGQFSGVRRQLSTFGNVHEPIH